MTFATASWLLEETATHVVTATIPGADSVQMIGPRETNLARMAADADELHRMPWHTQRQVWLTPFGAAHGIGHFWDHATDAFLCHYINLQAPLRRTAIGFDSFDHVLDVVVDPDGTWHWKDEEELDEAVGLGIFTPDEASAIRAEGERVIESFPSLLPTGWETWLPEASWPRPKLPPNWADLA